MVMDEQDLNDGEPMNSDPELTLPFREHVIQGLATLQAGVKGITERLDRVNGSIKELYLRTETNKNNLMEHAASCPLKDRVLDIDLLLATAVHPTTTEVNSKVTNLEMKVEKHLSERDTSAKWWKVLQPVIWAAAGTFLMLAVQHADILFKK